MESSSDKPERESKDSLPNSLTAFRLKTFLVLLVL